MEIRQVEEPDGSSPVSPLIRFDKSKSPDGSFPVSPLIRFGRRDFFHPSASSMQDEALPGASDPFLQEFSRAKKTAKTWRILVSGR
jgi:hypothetical protein